MMMYGQQEIVVCKSYEDAGRRAAEDMAALMRSLLIKRDEIRMVLAAGESQTTVLEALAQQPDLEWNRVVCINIDDLWDPRMDVTHSCGHQTVTQVYSKVHPKAYHLVNCNAPDIEAETKRFNDVYESLCPFDILCSGIGTSGHLALNEPGITSFDEPEMVKIVDVAEQTKRQLMVDPNFKAAGYVPDKGITLTIPAIIGVEHLFHVVPLAIKRDILGRVLATKEPDEHLPSSILSSVPGKIYVEPASFSPDMLV